MNNDDMINTAITRGRRIHCVVGSLKILDGEWTVRYSDNYTGDRVTDKNPEVITFLQTMRNSNLFYNVDTTKFPALMSPEDAADAPREDDSYEPPKTQM